MQISYTLDQLKAVLKFPEQVGSLTVPICSGIASLEKALPGDISFLSNVKYTKLLKTSKASIILVRKGCKAVPLPEQVFFYVESPSLALALLCADIKRAYFSLPTPQIHPSAVIDASAQIDPLAYIGPFCYVGRNSFVASGVHLLSHVYIGNDVTIGPNTYCGPQVTIYDRCVLGAYNFLDAGVVIGSEGYGYELYDGQHMRLPHIGSVVLEDCVDIGANSTIDRARFAVTQIGKGTKIDNQVQIAHNVSIGTNCLLVSQVGVAGSTVIEEGVVVAGQAGIAGHLTIGAGSFIGGQSGVQGNLAPKSNVRGSPYMHATDFGRVEFCKRQLPELFKRVAALEHILKTSTTD